jgi:7-carboxy-7-deazaguanine synthase (Cx14CxxC type)
MTYSIKEIYYTLQGEGAQTGRPAVFLRFAGCNLWSGREQDRSSSICRFCDTEFVGVDGPGGGKFKTADDLSAAVAQLWPAHEADAVPYVVCTGGEPLLQLDKAAIDSLHKVGFEIGVESNGTIDAPAGIDWLCISPKGRANLVQKSGDELKLVYPQTEAEAQPERFSQLEFRHFFLQPMDIAGETTHSGISDNTRVTIDYCLQNPRWKLSLQTHKMIGID